MKVTLQSYLLIIFLALLTSCCRSLSEKFDDILTIDLTQELTSITPIVVREISLSTGDDPIGHMSKFVPAKDGFFIMDAFRNTIWKFSETGEKIGKLHSVGNGPGEYSCVSEIDVYPNGDLAVFDFKTGKIHRYDGFLNFVSSIEIPERACGFSIGSDTSYFVNKAGDKHELNINLGHFNTADGDIEDRKSVV